MSTSQVLALGVASTAGRQSTTRIVSIGPLNTGGAYDPVTDTWRTISTVGAPVARWAHTAVWTGSEMLVWGGAGPSGDLGDGGAYDPLLDEWIGMPSAGAPSARVEHNGVWTGDAWVIWGGTADASRVRQLFHSCSPAAKAK